MPAQSSGNIKLLRFKQLVEVVTVSRPTIWNWVKAGTFPAPVQLNPGVPNGPVAWIESEVLAWKAARPLHRGFGPQPDCIEGLAHRAAVNRRNPKVYHFTRGAPLPPGYWKTLPEAE